MNATANVENSDSSIGNGAARLANEADSNFNNNIHGHKWGADLTDNLSSGMMSRRSAVSSAASAIANIIHSFLGHSVPEKGPLADEMSYMPDMIENLTRTLKGSRPKLENATLDLAKKMAKNLDLSEAYKQMQSSIDFETQKMSANISATANLKASKDRVRTVNNDNGVNINNTQNFYDKQASPYEQQKQSKQQLRRLAYEL